MDEFLIKMKIYKLDGQVNISGQYRIQKENNPNFERLIEILGVPHDITPCSCKEKVYGWKCGKITLIIKE